MQIKTVNEVDAYQNTIEVTRETKRRTHSVTHQLEPEIVYAKRTLKFSFSFVLHQIFESTLESEKKTPKFRKQKKIALCQVI